MITKKEFEEKLNFDVRDGYIYIEDVVIPSSRIYGEYLRRGEREALTLIDVILEEAKFLDRMLEHPSAGDIFPVMDSDLNPHIYGHIKGKYLTRIAPCDGDMGKAIKNLKKKSVLKKIKYGDVTCMFTESPFLTASHILIEDFKGILAVPNQGYMFLFNEKEDPSLVKKIMYESGASFSPPSGEINKVLMDGKTAY